MGRFLLQLVARPELWSDLALVSGVVVVSVWPDNWSVGVLSGVVALRIALDVLAAVEDHAFRWED